MTTETTVAPVAVETTVAPVAVETTVAPVAVKVSKVTEKVPHASISFNHSPLKDIFAESPAGREAAGIGGPLSHGWMTGKFAELSDNSLKTVGAKVGYSMVVTMVKDSDMTEFAKISDPSNLGFLDSVSDLVETVDAEKNSKKIEAEAKAAQKAIDKEAKAAQKLIDDADKKAKKEEAKLAKDIAEIDEAVAVINSDALDISGLFVGEEIVTPVAVVTPTVEADPILAAAIAAAQVNANVQAYADAPVVAPIAMAAE